METELKSIEFYEADFNHRFLTIKRYKSKSWDLVRIKVYIGDHQKYYGFGKTYQEALDDVYRQLLKMDEIRAKIIPLHPNFGVRG